MSRWWVSQAACDENTLELWFAPSYPEAQEQTNWRHRRAKEICAGCPVRTECLADELMVPLAAQFGVRGGMTVAERKRLLSRWRRAGLIPHTGPPEDREHVHILLTSTHDQHKSTVGA